MPIVTLTPDALADAERLPPAIQARLFKLIVRLAEWSNVSGAKALSGDLAGHFRLRTGDYRLQFRVEAGAAVVERIGHRDGFYDE